MNWMTPPHPGSDDHLCAIRFRVLDFLLWNGKDASAERIEALAHAQFAWFWWLMNESFVCHVLDRVQIV